MKHIEPRNHLGQIQLKFSVDGKRYCLNPIRNSEYSNSKAVAVARIIASTIERDILLGEFDTSLDKYRHRASQDATNKFTKLTQLWDYWVAQNNFDEHTIANHHKWVRRMMQKVDPSIFETDWLTNYPISNKTFNTRLAYVRSCFRWAINQKIISQNPWESRLCIKKLWDSKPDRSKSIALRLIQPFVLLSFPIECLTKSS